MASTQALSTVHLPRVEIKFCVQCKWNLRAAYYAQELLQTFSNAIGEIALVPVTGGIFTITIYHSPPNQQADTSQSTSNPVPPNAETVLSTNKATDSASQSAEVTTTQIWDRKADGGFPETKELKNRVRNLIDPKRDMGHIDRSLKKAQPQEADITSNTQTATADNKIKPEASGIESVESVASKHNHSDPAENAGEKKGIDDCEECKAAAAEQH